VPSGLLVSDGQDFPDFFRRAAAYVDKILKGAKPADLPVEQPTKLKLVVNLKTAKAAGPHDPTDANRRRRRGDQSVMPVGDHTASRRRGLDEARRVAMNIAKLPHLLRKARQASRPGNKAELGPSIGPMTKLFVTTLLPR
jgi:hypothetical protein